jgi:hypothetical protein
VVEGAALEKRCAGDGTVGSNPTLSASLLLLGYGRGTNQFFICRRSGDVDLYEVPAIQR